MNRTQRNERIAARDGRFPNTAYLHKPGLDIVHVDPYATNLHEVVRATNKNKTSVWHLLNAVLRTVPSDSLWIYLKQGVIKLGVGVARANHGPCDEKLTELSRSISNGALCVNGP
jgi:hypothetical protein